MLDSELKAMCEMSPTKRDRVIQQAKDLQAYLEAGGKISEIPAGVTAASQGVEVSYRDRESNRIRSQRGGASVRNSDKTKLVDL